MPRPAAPGPLLSIASESDRAPLFYRLFGRLDNIPINSFTPDIVDLPDHPGAEIYTLSVTRLSYSERNSLLRYMMDKHSLTREAAELYLESPGVIVYAEDCVVSGREEVVGI